jgi:hypothetical protein
MITAAEAERLLAGLPKSGHWAAQARAAVRLLTATEPTTRAARHEDEGGDDEFGHLFPPRTYEEAERQARRREKIAAATAWSDSELYEAIWGPES